MILVTKMLHSVPNVNLCLVVLVDNLVLTIKLTNILDFYRSWPMVAYVFNGTINVLCKGALNCWLAYCFCHVKKKYLSP